MNVVAISGNLTADPELKYTQSGTAVCGFTIAVRRPHTKDKTDFIDCVAWRERAEFLSKYFKKGSRVEASGHLETRTYEKDGSKRKVTELNCEEISFGSKKEDGSNQQNAQNGSAVQNYQPSDFQELSDEDGDLPF